MKGDGGVEDEGSNLRGVDGGRGVAGATEIAGFSGARPEESWISQRRFCLGERALVLMTRTRIGNALENAPMPPPSKTVVSSERR